MSIIEAIKDDRKDVKDHEVIIQSKRKISDY